MNLWSVLNMCKIQNSMMLFQACCIWVIISWVRKKFVSMNKRMSDIQAAHERIDERNRRKWRELERGLCDGAKGSHNSKWKHVLPGEGKCIGVDGHAYMEGKRIVSEAGWINAPKSFEEQRWDLHSCWNSSSKWLDVFNPFISERSWALGDFTSLYHWEWQKLQEQVNVK